MSSSPRSSFVALMRYVEVCSSYVNMWHRFAYLELRYELKTFSAHLSNRGM